LSELRGLLGLRVGELLEELASSSPVPASGSASALVAAMAAALVSMAARLAPDWEDARGVAAQADALRVRACRLAELDAEAYGAVLELREAPPDDRPEDRDFQLGGAFSHAADVPLEIAGLAEDVAELAAIVADASAHAPRADAAGAAVLAAAAARSAASLVTINLAVAEGDPRPGRANMHAAAAELSAQRALEASG
jgi:formiminotetrahydrofolate cyclodeaminase